MERWNGKVAVVTGASSGIGSAIVLDLIKSGMIVIGLARRVEMVEALQQNASPNGKLYAKRCDVTSETDIKEVFQWIETTFGGVHVLVNNAGTLLKSNLVDEDNTDTLRKVMDTNVIGCVMCTREAFQIMKRCSINDGHVIIINSILGHKVPYFGDTINWFNLYPSSKYAVTAMTEILRQEFHVLKTKIKISVNSVSPGVVRTEIFHPELWSEMQGMPFMNPEDISQAILYILGTPPHVQIHELTIKPLGEVW